MSTLRAPRRMILGSMFATAALAGSMALGLAGAGPATAMTPNVSDGSTQEVCADHLALRTIAAPNGPDQGELFNGDHVLVHSHAANGMLYVYAYGQLNRNGYVDDGHFCSE